MLGHSIETASKYGSPGKNEIEKAASLLDYVEAAWAKGINDTPPQAVGVSFAKVTDHLQPSAYAAERRGIRPVKG